MRPSENLNGPIMVIVLLCLAVALEFTSFGLGFLNFATNNRLDSPGEQALAPAPELRREPANLVQRLEQKKALLSTKVRTKQDEVSQQRERAQSSKTNVTQLSAEIDTGARRLEELRSQSQMLQQDIARLRRQFGSGSGRSLVVARAEAKLEEARKAVTAMEAKIARLRQALINAQSVDPQDLLAGNQLAKSSVMVECRQDGAVLLPQGVKIPTAELSTHTGFAEAVRGSQVIVLVRPSGFSTFDTVRKTSKAFGATSVGYEPFNEEWLLRYQVEDKWKGETREN